MNCRRSQDPGVGQVRPTGLAGPIPIAILGLFLALSPHAGAGTATEETSSSPPPQGEEESPPKETSAKKAPPRKTAARKPASTEGASAAAPAEPAPLKFTDFDLEKYHRPAAAAEDADEEEGQGVTGELSPPAVPGRSPAPLSPPRKAQAARKAPPPVAPPTPEDPLKPFKDRQARETFRSKQIQDLRDKIGQIESRLQYLKAKREALQNPAAPLQVGRTRGPDDPPDPVPGPGKVPVQKEPTAAGKTPPSVFPGAGRLAVAPMFPPLPPPQTDEDRERDKTMKVRDLLAEVEKEIETVEAELEETRTILVDIETRFGAEAGIR